jgi:putative hydrolase of the HAD superfamily
MVACSGTGSTLLMSAFSEVPQFYVTSQLVLGHDRVSETFQCDYSIFRSPDEHSVFQAAMKAAKQFLINVEELGNDRRKGERGYNIFPSPGAHDLVMPAFWFRDPIRTFDTWKNIGWTDIDSFVDCYHDLFRIMNFSETVQPCTVLYERLVENPPAEIKRICQRWEIPSLEEPLNFKKSFVGSLFRSKGGKRVTECETTSLEIGAEATSSGAVDFPFHNLVTKKEKEYIENEIGRLYVDVWGAKVVEVRDILREKEWFGFDLDDTLHEFRKASGAATASTLNLIAEKYILSLVDLGKTYSEVLAQKTSTAFVEGKSSHEYRKERFSAVLEHYSVQVDDRFLAKLLLNYEHELTSALELKCGAFDLLKLLKSLGKKVVVITEGPEDAQRRTVQALGIAHMIDFLATTNSFGLSKSTGLFRMVLVRLGICAADIAYIGDNADRDMTPALAEGIYSVHYAEQRPFSLDTTPVTINTLRKLGHMIS